MNNERTAPWSWTQVAASWIAVLLLVFLLLSLSIGATSGGGGNGKLIDSVNNCRNIISAIKIYAADNNDAYPDAAVPGAKDSNTVFRQLVVAKKVDSEKMFGSPLSPFVPDGELGTAPDYSRSVEPGENHWAMTKGLNSKSEEWIPLVYENPVEATWPPVWNADAVEKKVKGRVWKSGRVIVGRNDGSVAVENLDSRTGSKVSLKRASNGNLFEWVRDTPDGAKLEVLDVSVKKS